MADDPIPLCSVAQFTEGAFADLVTAYPADALQDALAEATRMAEEITDRRLAPFTITETVRVAAIPPDEHNMRPRPFYAPPPTQPANPIPTGLIRHFWLHERPRHYQDLWQWSLGTIVTSGPNSYTITDVIDGPDDEGHVWVQPGQYLTPGSRCRVTYSGGYNPYPASLVRAGKFLTAYIIVRELNPDDTAHDPDWLHTDAVMALADWSRA